MKMHIPVFHLPGDNVTVLSYQLSMAEWDEPTKKAYTGKTGTIVWSGNGRYLVRFDSPARIPFSSTPVIMTHDMFRFGEIVPTALAFLFLE